jgi:hypothetical protein
VSYGIICDKIYDPETHVGEPVRLDPRDKKTFAIDQVDWLVIQVEPISFYSCYCFYWDRTELTSANFQGNSIPYTGIRKEFQLKMDTGRETGPWKVQIVMSTLTPERLPSSLSQSGVDLVCSLEIATESVDKKLKNRHWYSRKPAFWRTKFDVKVVVGPADLSFQLWSKDRRIRSKKHDPIAVKWMPAK